MSKLSFDLPISKPHNMLLHVWSMRFNVLMLPLVVNEFVHELITCLAWLLSAAADDNVMHFLLFRS